MAEAVRTAKYVSIATDASTNVNCQSVVNYIAMTRPIFFKAIYTKDNSHTADDLARTTAAVIEEIRAEEVVGVLTNNAAPNKAASKMQQQEFRSSNLTCMVCCSRLNLMTKDKLDVFKDVLGQMVQMIKFFKNKHRPNGWRKHSEACAAQLFRCKRRWRCGGWATIMRWSRSSSPRRHCNAWCCRGLPRGLRRAKRGGREETYIGWRLLG